MPDSRPTPPSSLPRGQTDAVVPVTVGTALWAVALVVTLVMRATLVEHGTQWWVWTCVTGLLLGLFGCWWVRRRRDRLASAAPPAADHPPDTPQPSPRPSGPAS